MKEKRYDVIIIGAGAAGLLAAGETGKAGLKTLVLEKMERAGRKLFITGKGRCNITNVAPKSEFFKKTYPNGKFLKKAYHRFFSDDIIRLIENQGVPVTIEQGGRVFPASNKSGDVVKALLQYAQASPNVEIKYKSEVKEITFDAEDNARAQFLEEEQEKSVTAKTVLIVTGGKSYPATGSTGDGYQFATSLGHTSTQLLPALVPLETAGNLATSMQGLSLKNVKASLWVNQKKQCDEFGEMLFTHFGLSGPVILTLSRQVVTELNKKNKVEIHVDLKPALDDQKLDRRLIRDLNDHGRKKMENLFRLWLPSKMIIPFMKLVETDPNMEAHQLNANTRKKIRYLMKNLEFQVTGYRPFEEAIITMGGIPTREIDAATMQSKIRKNLWFAGEIIDLDAETGGYNLQIAWSTAFVAARSIIHSLKT
ncbi:MAG: NAD(P)/FAD-dependent oxidoreductase [Bacteroidales bacterium]